MAIQLEVFSDKVKALHVHILEECKRQGITVYEFERLVTVLIADLSERQRKVYDEPF